MCDVHVFQSCKRFMEHVITHADRQLGTPSLDSCGPFCDVASRNVKGVLVQAHTEIKDLLG